MSVTLILTAREIPDLTVVRKPTGTNEFTLRRGGIPIYTYLGVAETQIFGADMLILQDGTSLTVCGSASHLAIDFDTYMEAANFLAELNDEE